MSILKQEYKEGEMTLTSALDLAIKVLSKTLDTTKLTHEKGKEKLLRIFTRNLLTRTPSPAFLKYLLLLNLFEKSSTCFQSYMTVQSVFAKADVIFSIFLHVKVSHLNIELPGINLALSHTCFEKRF